MSEENRRKCRYALFTKEDCEKAEWENYQRKRQFSILCPHRYRFLLLTLFSTTLTSIVSGFVIAKRRASFMKFNRNSIHRKISKNFKVSTKFKLVKWSLHLMTGCIAVQKLCQLWQQLKPFCTVYGFTIFQATYIESNFVYHCPQVLLLDIGGEIVVDFSELRRLRGVSAKYIDIPARVFECRLAFLQPSIMHSDRYEWQSIMAQFKNLTFDEKTTIEVHTTQTWLLSLL